MTQSPTSLSEERRFLHDLSSPVSTLTLLMEVLKECPAGGTEEDECMERMAHMIRRLTELIQTRRKILIGLSPEAGR